MTTKHSKLGASSMYRWKACPGSVRLCAVLPAVTSVYSEEGSTAHESAADILKEQIARLLAHRMIRSTTSSDWDFPESMDKEAREAVMLYVDTVLDDYLTRSGPSKYPDSPWTANPQDEIMIEHRFDLSSVYRGCFGTADCVSWHAGLKLLRVYDYKHGSGVYVEVENNDQLQYYGLGALLSLGFPAREVEIVVVQPRHKCRKGPVRRWRRSVVDLLEFQSELVEAAQATEVPDAPLVPGRHCWFCPAKSAVPQCPALVKKRQDAAAEAFPEVVADEEVVDPLS